jgi:hypothetical protein
LNPKSSFEEGAEEGDAVSRSPGLGDVPTANLASELVTKVIEETQTGSPKCPSWRVANGE